MSSRDTILREINRNRPPATEMPSIHLGGKPLADITGDFLTALGKVSAQATRLRSFEEAARLFQQSIDKGNLALNTVPEIGPTDIEAFKAKSPEDLAMVYQAWVPGAMGVAENGAIWLNESAIVNRLLPFICEHLVIVLEAKNLVGNMHDAYSRITIDREGFGVFLAGPSKTADIEQSLVVGAHGARSLIVYLVDPEYIA